MSGIAGLYRGDGQPADHRGVERMVAALAHRGSDAAGVWCDGAMALGQTARWTTPEARHERLPLTAGAHQLTITADARLDNRRELTALLGIVGSPAAEIGDGELILRAYERWGADCVGKLVGDFAFAVWDDRTQTLFCARDHIGVKPFYYYEAPGLVLFASEIKALLTSPAVPYRLNALRVADHLAGLFDDPAITFYRDICRLPPGHTLTANRAGTRVAPYWSLDPARELALGSDEAYTEAFRECFTEAVRCRLRGGSVGCLLSGGLDTSSIVATARLIRGNAGHESLDTFSAIFPGLPPADLEKIDERAFIDAVVGQGGLEAHYVHGDLLSPLNDVDRALWHLDEAFAAPNLYLHWALYGAARSRGVRALLDGIDGDTTVSHGLEYLAELTRGAKVVTLSRELRALSRRYNKPARRLFWRFGVQTLVPEAVHRVAGFIRGRKTPGWMANTVMKPEFARRVGIVERVEASERMRRQPARSGREAHWRGMSSGLIPYALEIADKAAAAFGIEPRYPFLDRRLMELCLALPADQKLRDGWTRAVLRRAMGGILPEKVRWRPGKANLSPNFKRRLLTGDGGVLREVVLGQSEVIEEYVDILALRRAYERYAADPTSEVDALTVYSAVVLALWLQRAKIAS